jgi:hypothetical protein
MVLRSLGREWLGSSDFTYEVDRMMVTRSELTNEYTDVIYCVYLVNMKVYSIIEFVHLLASSLGVGCSLDFN